MAKARTPEAKVRSWVEGVLAQAAEEEIASTTLAVLWNAGSLGRPSASGPLAELLREPFAALGSRDPALDAALVAHGTVGQLSDWLWDRVLPTRAQIAHVAELWLAAVGHSRLERS